ncbi:MAG: WcaF family extracellular polysaccharide biosynthesis acetyltransferase [Plectolyngbya sp. WJT66-NPBG17]|nr:WcaF family extracellular polysaccharide biosynthesis acetyltransferase [Plectolyngbya sp. WJT66-NPBG17]MBW4524958.1 WcaF family extracellular polysaccharide biosynthesis acetyltransferase [Phormidium tanganyikae FI6-MK23]
MDLEQYTTGTYTPGAPVWKQLLWFFLGDPIVRSRLLPISSLKVWVLRSFGASIGQGVRIKPGVRVKFPWRLTIGNHCWIGENAWFDNLAPIVLGDHICVSQSVYFCTGNHDWTAPLFDLRVAPIAVGSGSWLAARSTIAPGVEIGEGAVLSLGSVAVRSLSSWTIYAGNPAVAIKPRVIKDQRFSSAELLNA